MQTCIACTHGMHQSLVGSKLRPVQDQVVPVQLLSSLSLDDELVKPYDAIINLAEPEPRNVGIIDVYQMNRVMLAKHGILREGVEQQLYEDGVSLFCHRSINNIDSAAAAYPGNRHFMGRRMIVLALALGAQPDQALKDSMLALSFAWAFKDRALVRFLLDKDIPIP
ncbi:MAG: hypothetical protein AB7F19_07060 [Candidatus Babeliales bacterium]